MDTSKRHDKIIALTIAMVLCLPLSAHAEQIDKTWSVRAGDSLYRIARKLAPKDPKTQAKIRREITRLNPDMKPSRLEIGQNLKLPAFLYPKPAIPVAPAPTAIPKPPVQVQVSQQPASPTQATVKQEVIGQVVIKTGNMAAENNGNTRELERHANIFKGDTIKTADNARGQIRMKDGALISVSPGTKLAFDDFVWDGKQDGTERSIMSLIRGGLRTITGAIGHLNKRNYQVRTTVATIGIRGTHYGLMLCQSGSCNNQQSGNLKDGLYGGVVNGSIVTHNQTGTHTFNTEQFFHIQTANSLPVQVLVPPPIFNDTTRPVKPGSNKRNIPGSQTAGGGRSPGPGHKPNGGVPPGQHPFNRNPMVANLTGHDFLPPLSGTGTFSPNQPPPTDNNQNLPVAAPTNSGVAVSLTQVGTSTKGVAAPVIVNAANNNGIFLEQITDSSGRIIANLPFSVHEEHFDSYTNQIQTHTASRLNSAGSGAHYDLNNMGGSPLGVNWGAWAGTSTNNYTLLENGSALPHANYLHYIYSDNLTPLTTLNSLGGLVTKLSLYKFAGGTHPTDNLGNISTGFPQISAGFDFVNQTMIHYGVDVTDFGGTGINWSAHTSAPITFSNLSDSFQLVPTYTDCPYCSGEASVTFVGSNGGGVMTSYTVYDSTHLYGLSYNSPYSVNGVALLTPAGTAVANNSVGLFAASDGFNQEAFAAYVDSFSHDNVFMGTDANGTKAPVAALAEPVTSSYQEVLINPSQATASSTFDTTTIPNTTVYWGNWDQGTFVKNGAVSMQGVVTHFIGSDNMTTMTQLQNLSGVLGTLTYNIANNGTAFDADFNGLAASSARISMTANFTSQLITAYGATVGGGASAISGFMDATSPVAFNAAGNFALNTSSTCAPNCSAIGSASVQFVGNNAEGAITSFSMNDNINSAAGVAVMTHP